MKILLLSSAYNGLTQRVHVELLQRGHTVSIEVAINEHTMLEGVQLFKPDIIICPFLKHRIPESVWRHYVCIVVHPGIKGDRGMSSLDWAIQNEETEWGVTALQAAAEMDTGDIWATAISLHCASAGFLTVQAAREFCRLRALSNWREISR